MRENENNLVDTTDYRILRELIRDGRASDVTLGERIHLSSTATARRRKILEESGVVDGYTAKLNMAKLGFSITAMVSIELSPSMSFCSFVSGEVDFIMIVHVRSFEDYDRVYRRELSMLPHVARIRSSFLMREVVQRSVAPAVVDDQR
jgi:Lrp/AsnC family leucine-responsive transcriptional regulator